MGMEIALLIILVVLVVVLFAFSYMKKKKYNNELNQMRTDLKVGDKVMTDTGVVGVVVDSYMEDEYKYFVLKSGKDNNVGYFTVHANAIYYVFESEAKKEEKIVVKVAKEQVAENDNKQSNKTADTKTKQGAKKSK